MSMCSFIEMRNKMQSMKKSSIVRMEFRGLTDVECFSETSGIVLVHWVFTYDDSHGNEQRHNKLVGFNSKTYLQCF